MLYTIIPTEQIFCNDDGNKKTVLIRVNGILTECTLEGSNATVNRIISSRPRDYVENSNIIGRVIKYERKN